MVFYLGSTLRVFDDLLSDLEIHDSNQNQSLKGDGSKTKSSSSEDVLKQLGRSRALSASTVDFSLEDSFNLQYGMYYVQRRIGVGTDFSSRKMLSINSIMFSGRQS